MHWKHLPIVAFDTETTGLHPFGGDRIIEFAAVSMHIGPDGKVSDVSEHSWLVNPGIPIPHKVTEITGITDADVADAPPFKTIADDVHALLQGAITVAHNYPFDLNFISQELNRVDLVWPEPLAEIDTVDLSIKSFPDARSHRLKDVCKRMDVSLVGAHRATNDAEACGRVFIELARRADVEDSLQAMLEWANAIGRPPENGPFTTNPAGTLVFADGPHEGSPIGHHPIYLAWMTKARQQATEGWQWRFSESTRRWVRRWLDIRGSGRSRPSMKSFRSDDWIVDSCIAEI